jgi:hypothetical protein
MALSGSAARTVMPTTSAGRVVAVAHQVRTDLDGLPMLQHRLQIVARALGELAFIISGQQIPMSLKVEPEHADQLAYTKTEGDRSRVFINGNEVIARNISADSSGHAVPDTSGIWKMMGGLVYHEMGHIMLTPRWVDDFPAAALALRDNLVSLRTYLESIAPSDAMEFVFLYYMMASYLDASVIDEETRKALQLQPVMARLSGRMEEIIHPWLTERLDYVPGPERLGAVEDFINTFGTSPEMVKKVEDLEKQVEKIQAEMDQKQAQLNTFVAAEKAKYDKIQADMDKKGVSKRVARRHSTQEVTLKADVDLAARRIVSLNNELSQVRSDAGHGGQMVEALNNARTLKQVKGEEYEQQSERDIMELFQEMMVNVMRYDRSRPSEGCVVRYQPATTLPHEAAKERIVALFNEVLPTMTLPPKVGAAQVAKNFETLLERAIGVAESQSQSDTAGNNWVMLVQSEAPNGNSVMMQFAMQRNLIEDQRLETQLSQMRAGLPRWFTYNVAKVFDPNFRYGLTAGRFFLDPKELSTDQETTRATGRSDATKPPIEGMLEWMGPIAAVYVPLTSPRGKDEPNDVALMGHIQAFSYLVERIFWPTERDLLAPLTSGIEPGDIIKIDAPVPTGVHHASDKEAATKGAKERAQKIVKVQMEESPDPFDAQRKVLAGLLDGMARWVRRRAAVHSVMDDLNLPPVELPETKPLTKPLKLPQAPAPPPPVAVAPPTAPGGPTPSGPVAPVPVAQAPVMLPGVPTLGPNSPPARTLPTNKQASKDLELKVLAIPGNQRVLVTVNAGADAPDKGTTGHVNITGAGISRGVDFSLKPVTQNTFYPITVDIYDLPKGTKFEVDVWATAPGYSPGPVKHMEVTTFS